MEKYNVSLTKLPQQGTCISEPEFYGDLVYRFRNIVGKSNFSEQFRKLINRYKRMRYNLGTAWYYAADCMPILLTHSRLIAMFSSLIV